MDKSLLQIKDLDVSFKGPEGQFQAVKAASFNIEKGQTLALVGESGSGKSVTALSTSEAEYMSISDAAREARALLKLNKTLENRSQNKIKIFEDNRGCIKWTHTQAEPNRTKHIDVHYHHIKDWVKLGAIEIDPVATDLQLADALTKPLSRERHEFLMEKYCGGLAPVF